MRGEDNLTISYSAEVDSVEVIVSAGGFNPNEPSVVATASPYVATGLNHSTETLYSNVTTDDRVAFTTLGVNGIYDVENGTLTLFPNPASDKVNVTVGGFEGEVEVEIVDMNGRRVAGYTTKDSELTINVSDLAQGAYFVRVTGDTHTAVRKLIVK